MAVDKPDAEATENLSSNDAAISFGAAEFATQATGSRSPIQAAATPDANAKAAIAKGIVALNMVPRPNGTFPAFNAM